jgi:hypothetical protein
MSHSNEILATQSPTTPQGRLVTTTQGLATTLEKLAIAAKEGDKKVMVTAAKDITENLGDLIKSAQAMAETCTDPKLKEALLNAAGVPKSIYIVTKGDLTCKDIAIQLKILSSVRAAQEDKESEQQLFSIPSI